MTHLPVQPPLQSAGHINATYQLAQISSVVLWPNRPLVTKNFALKYIKMEILLVRFLCGVGRSTCLNVSKCNGKGAWDNARGCGTLQTFNYLITTSCSPADQTKLSLNHTWLCLRGCVECKQDSVTKPSI